MIPELKPSRRAGVLFVCYANLCRSPLAEGIFRHMIRARGLERGFMVDSAGVSARVGARPHLHSVRVAASRGIELSGKSRQIVRADLYRFHHIIVLDREVHRQLMQLIGPVTRRGPRVEPVHDPRGEIRLFATLANPAARGRGLDITDPVREPEATFESTCVALLAGCEALLNELAP